MLDERLRTHIDSLAEPVALSEVLGRQVDDGDSEVSLAPATPLLVDADAADLLHNGSLRLAAAAAVLLAMVAGGLLFLAAQNDAPITVTSEEHEASVELPVLPADIGGETWRKVDEPFPALGEGNAVQVTSATVANGVVWAVGFESRIAFDSDRVDTRSRGAIWRSDDGETWTPIDADFGSLDIPGGNWAPSGVSFEHVVTTSDGAVWAFGNELRDSIKPVGYRSVDGETWTALDLSDVSTPDEESVLLSVSVDANSVLIVVTDFGRSVGESTRTATTDDGGETWRVESQDLSTSDGFAAVASGGDVVSITGLSLPGSTNGPRSLVAGGGIFVASGVDEDADAEPEVVEEGVSATQAGLLWYSRDGVEWFEIARDPRPGSFEIEPQLFSHRDGVIAAIEWFDEDSAGVSLFAVDRNGSAKSLGELPLATFTEMFVLDGSLFIIGSADSAVFDENAQEDASVWIAEVSSPESPEIDTPVSSSAQFELCGEVLESPDRPLDVVEDADGRIDIQADIGSLDRRVQLCRDVINEHIELELTGSSSSEGVRPVSPAQAQALADGVTDAEYEEAFGNLQQCMERGGGEITRNPEVPGHVYSFPDSARFLHDVCAQWHFERIDSIWQVQTQSAAAADLAEVVEKATLKALDNARSLEWSELIDEADTAGCRVVADGDWITTFDDMTQPLCLIVGEEHAFDFWNKGYERATVDWAGDERVLTSDSSFETGRIGDTYPAGRHVVVVDPYGEVELFVIPSAISVSEQIRIESLIAVGPGRAFDGLLGLDAGSVENMLGIELVIIFPAEQGRTCWLAAASTDPYAPLFLFFGDATFEDSVFVGVADGTLGC